MHPEQFQSAFTLVDETNFQTPTLFCTLNSKEAAIQRSSAAIILHSLPKSWKNFHCRTINFVVVYRVILQRHQAKARSPA